MLRSYKTLQLKIVHTNRYNCMIHSEHSIFDKDGFPIISELKDDKEVMHENPLKR